MKKDLYPFLGLLLLSLSCQKTHSFSSSPLTWRNNNIKLSSQGDDDHHHSFRYDGEFTTTKMKKGCCLSMISSRNMESSSSSSSSSSQQTLDENNEIMRNEIETLKLEALRRIDKLSSRMDLKNNNSNNNSMTSSLQPISEATTTTTIQSSSSSSETTTTTISSSSRNLETENIMVDDDSMKIVEKKKGVVIKKDEADLLDGTYWKVALNIGREPGTWMPKTWGISGERLLINFDIEFLPVQLFEREEFLGRMAGSKMLRVTNNQLTLSPTLTEGTRQIHVKDGGWRVSRGEGPLGTDMLRFYVEIEEEVRHQGGDVYCPAGRIYCTCGYFPTSSPDSGAKERYRKRLESVVSKIERMNDQLESDTSLLSFNKIKLSKDIFQMKVEAQRLNERYNACRVIEPDIDLLKLSKDKSVGLTREGGVCCKVRKGVAIEYHILGRFSLASTDPPERD